MKQHFNPVGVLRIIIIEKTHPENDALQVGPMRRYIRER